MTTLRTILFATDLSEHTTAAFPIIRSLAGTGRLVVLHVVEQVLFADSPKTATGAGLPVFWPSDTPAQREALQERLRAAYPSEQLAAVDYLVRDGDAADMILGAAEENSADLIALGTHGRRGLDRLLSGSVAETVLRRAQCSVLVHHHPEELSVQPERTRLVVHPTDFSAPSHRAFAIAHVVARSFDARLLVLHVATPGADDCEEAAQQLEALQQHVEALEQKRDLETRLTSGDPVAEILKVAAENSGSLIVMGTHGRTGLSRLLMGSTAQSVLRDAPCPALIVKTAGA